MPEIGEVARIVNYIQKHLVGKTLAAVKAQHDENVFGKVGCSAEAFEKALKGKKVVDARQQGKYFWMVMSSPPHPLMHFGMAGWFKIRDEETAYYKPTKPEDSTEWPPKYWKFAVATAEKPVCEAADEVLYDARIHPEQYSNTLSSAQVKQLHKSIQYVCGLAVDTLADSSKFPEEWLFKHRWGKGKKDSTTTLPNGSKFVFLTVGGRTSCVVPSVQKKTGPVKKDIEEEPDEDGEMKSEEETKPAKRKRTSKTAKEDSDEVDVAPASKSSKGKRQKVKQEEGSGVNGAVKEEDTVGEESKHATKKRKSTTNPKSNGTDTKSAKQDDMKPATKATSAKAQSESNSKRRSTRNSGGGI
ncbi:hypothetical protein P7C71_g290, partial [Lecanoromycetidae sp. Uapishka_2]